MATIHIIGLVPEDLHRFCVKGASSNKLAKVLFPELKPWSLIRETISNSSLEFESIHQESNNVDAVFQASFDASHLSQNHFVFACPLPEEVVCRSSSVEPENELTRWTNFARSVIDFTLNNRSQSHVLLLEEEIDSVNIALKSIGEQLAVNINAKPNAPVSEPKQHLANMISYVFFKERTLNGVLSELVALSSVNNLANNRPIDLLHVLTSFSMLLKADEANVQCKKAITKVEQQLLHIEEQLKSEMQKRNDKIENLEAENRLSQLQTFQLQEELESLYSEMQKESKFQEQLKEVNHMNGSLNKQLASLQNQFVLLENNNDTANGNIKAMEDLVQEMDAENKLCLLQIAQLQEELELYYNKDIRIQDMSSVNPSLSGNDLSLRLIANYLPH